MTFRNPAAIMLASVCAVMLAFSGVTLAQTPKYGGTLRVGISRDVIGMDPNIGYGVSSSSLQGNLFDTLVEFTEDGSLVPALAESWETPDPTTYVFHLRKGVTWHDGSPFTSADVKFTLERVLDPEASFTRQKELSVIERIETPDSHTVRVELREPYGALLDVFAGRELYIASKAWIEADNDPVNDVMGTGPFMLQSYEPGSEYVLVRNDNYWKEGLPYVDRLILRPYEDDNARINALRGGEVDFAEYIPWTFLSVLERDRNFKVTVGYDSFNVVRINHNRPPFDDVRVRQALNYIIDRQAVLDVAFGGYGMPITGGLLPEDHWAYNAHLDGTYETNWDKARELLAEAGVDPAAVEFTVTSSVLTYHDDVGQAVLAQLRQFGFTEARYETIQTSTLLEKRRNGDYTLMADGLGMSWPDPDSLSMYFETNGSGHAAGVNFADAELDALFDEARRSTDQDHRMALYSKMEERYLELAPWIFLLYRPQTEAMSAKVNGWVRFGAGLGTDSMGRMEYIWLD